MFELYGIPMVIFEVLFFLLFFLILGTFIVSFAQSLGQWNRNNHAPRLTVSAAVVTKRMELSRHTHHNAGDVTGAHGVHHSTSTRYYVTFQVDSGDRMELAVNGGEYGLLAEGDRGKLTFQGTRYLGFERN